MVISQLILVSPVPILMQCASELTIMAWNDMIMQISSFQLPTIITTIVIILAVVLILFFAFGVNDIFANFFAGIALRFRRNIKVGDTIRISQDKRKIQGKVEAIGLQYIKLNTGADELVYIPNVMMLRSVITKIRNQ